MKSILLIITFINVLISFTEYHQITITEYTDSIDYNLSAENTTKVFPKNHINKAYQSIFYVFYNHYKIIKKTQLILIYENFKFSHILKYQLFTHSPPIF